MFSDFCLLSLLICITVVIIGDKPTGLYIAYNIYIVLMCAVSINAVQELLKCGSVAKVRSESCGRVVNFHLRTFVYVEM